MIGFWIFMVITDLLIPFIMIGLGKTFMNQPPQKINYLFGYRTAMSMKNRDTWEFAHKYCGRLWFKLGLVLLPVSVLPLLLVFGKDDTIVGMVGKIVCCVQIIPLVVSAIFTENALRKEFDKTGKRKNA